MTIHLPKPTIVLLSLAAILLVAPTVSDVHGAPDSTAANDAFVEGWTR